MDEETKQQLENLDKKINELVELITTIYGCLEQLLRNTQWIDNVIKNINKE